MLPEKQDGLSTEELDGLSTEELDGLSTEELDGLSTEKQDNLLNEKQDDLLTAKHLTDSELKDQDNMGVINEHGVKNPVDDDDNNKALKKGETDNKEGETGMRKMLKGILEWMTEEEDSDEEESTGQGRKRTESGKENEIKETKKDSAEPGGNEMNSSINISTHSKEQSDVTNLKEGVEVNYVDTKDRGPGNEINTSINISTHSKEQSNVTNLEEGVELNYMEIEDSGPKRKRGKKNRKPGEGSLDSLNESLKCDCGEVFSCALDMRKHKYIFNGYQDVCRQMFIKTFIPAQEQVSEVSKMSSQLVAQGKSTRPTEQPSGRPSNMTVSIHQDSSIETIPQKTPIISESSSPKIPSNPGEVPFCDKYKETSLSTHKKTGDQIHVCDNAFSDSKCDRKRSSAKQNPCESGAKDEQRVKPVDTDVCARLMPYKGKRRGYRAARTASIDQDKRKVYKASSLINNVLDPSRKVSKSSSAVKPKQLKLAQISVPDNRRSRVSTETKDPHSRSDSNRKPHHTGSVQWISSLYSSPPKQIRLDSPRRAVATDTSYTRHSHDLNTSEIQEMSQHSVHSTLTQQSQDNILGEVETQTSKEVIEICDEIEDEIIEIPQPPKRKTSEGLFHALNKMVSTEKNNAKESGKKTKFGFGKKTVSKDSIAPMNDNIAIIDKPTDRNIFKDFVVRDFSRTAPIFSVQFSPPQEIQPLWKVYLQRLSRMHRPTWEKAKAISTGIGKDALNNGNTVKVTEHDKDGVKERLPVISSASMLSQVMYRLPPGVELREVTVVLTDIMAVIEAVHRTSPSKPPQKGGATSVMRCVHCKKPFTSRFYLKLHLLKRHKCTACRETYPLYNHLRTHLQFHPDCTSAYLQALERHSTTPYKARPSHDGPGGISSGPQKSDNKQKTKKTANQNLSEPANSNEKGSLPSPEVSNKKRKSKEVKMKQDKKHKSNGLEPSAARPKVGGSIQVPGCQEVTGSEPAMRTSHPESVVVESPDEVGGARGHQAPAKRLKVQSTHAAKLNIEKEHLYTKSMPHFSLKLSDLGNENYKQMPLKSQRKAKSDNEMPPLEDKNPHCGGQDYSNRKRKFTLPQNNFRITSGGSSLGQSGEVKVSKLGERPGVSEPFKAPADSGGSSCNKETSRKPVERVCCKKKRRGRPPDDLMARVEEINKRIENQAGSCKVDEQIKKDQLNQNLPSLRETTLTLGGTEGNYGTAGSTLSLEDSATVANTNERQDLETFSDNGQVDSTQVLEDTPTVSKAIGEQVETHSGTCKVYEYQKHGDQVNDKQGHCDQDNVKEGQGDQDKKEELGDRTSKGLQCDSVMNDKTAEGGFGRGRWARKKPRGRRPSFDLEARVEEIKRKIQLRAQTSAGHACDTDGQSQLCTSGPQTPNTPPIETKGDKDELSHPAPSATPPSGSNGPVSVGDVQKIPVVCLKCRECGSKFARRRQLDIHVLFTKHNA